MLIALAGGMVGMMYELLYPGEREENPSQSSMLVGLSGWIFTLMGFGMVARRKSWIGNVKWDKGRYLQRGHMKMMNKIWSVGYMAPVIILTSVIGFLSERYYSRYMRVANKAHGAAFCYGLLSGCIYRFYGLGLTVALAAPLTICHFFLQSAVWMRNFRAVEGVKMLHQGRYPEAVLLLRTAIKRRDGTEDEWAKVLTLIALAHI